MAAETNPFLSFKFLTHLRGTLFQGYWESWSKKCDFKRKTEQRVNVKDVKMQTVLQESEWINDTGGMNVVKAKVQFVQC